MQPFSLVISVPSAGTPVQLTTDTTIACVSLLIKALASNAGPTVYVGRSELVQRLLGKTCELCGSTQSIQVHHIRALNDLRRPGRPDKPLWVKMMAARRRKTLIVCHACHTAIHAGRSSDKAARHKTLESRVR